MEAEVESTQSINLLDFQKIGKGKNGEPGNPYDILDDKIAEYIALAVKDYDANKQYILDGVAAICAKYPLYE